MNIEAISRNKILKGKYLIRNRNSNLLDVSLQGKVVDLLNDCC